MPTVTPATVNVVEVAFGMLVNVPPLTLTCHCPVGVGFPVAVAAKVAACPPITVWFAGLVVIASVGSAYQLLWILVLRAPIRPSLRRCVIAGNNKPLCIREDGICGTL